MSDPAASRFDLQVLGPARLLLAGRPQPLKTRKALALLLLLALEGDLSRPRLCAWLWPGLDESSARRNLRRELVRLREAGAATAVRVDGDRLRCGPELGCDLLRAEALLAGKQPDAALALWQGEAVDGLEAEGDDDAGLAPWLAALRQRVQALHRRALEVSASAAEARGDLPAALARVQTLLQLDGLQEGHHRDAMRLLAGTGQREAALRQFETCRALLAAELGLQPMPQTLALAVRVLDAHHRDAMRLLAGTGQREAALRQFETCRTLLAAELGLQPMPQTLALAESLRQGPATSPSPPTLDVVAAMADRVVQLPPQLPFVGREPEVQRLQRAWSRRQAVLLVGEAGVGKTRLATDFAAAQGPYALLRCQAGDRELPFAAFARALRVLAGQPPDLAALEPWVVAELARLLPEIGPAPPPLRNQNERLRFDEACVRAWQALAGEAFDAVVLDDWQLADADSRSLLARVVARRREQGGAGAIELLAWRGEADDPELQATAEALAADTLSLGPLPDAAVHELVRQLSGAAAPARFAQRLRSATGGHPFFIVETLRDLAERALLRGDADGRWHTPFDAQTEDYRELPLPASVRDAVLARVRRLGAPAARLLEAAALAGEPLLAARLAQACAFSEIEALAALEQAVQAQLVLAHEAGGFAWAHDLARQALVSALAPTRARLVHHRLALAAEAMGARVDAARHFEACGEPARAVPHRLAAGDAAHALHALAEAAAQWRQGLADSPGPADEAALLARLCYTEWLRGRYDESQALHGRLQGLLADPAITPEARSDLQLRAARYLSGCGPAQDAVALLEAMAPPKSPAQVLRWRIERMGALHQCGRLDEALAEGQAALQSAAAGTRERADVLIALSTLEHSRGQMQAAVARADASLALFTRLGDHNGRARGLLYRGAFSLELGDRATGEADLREAAALAARHGNVFLQRLALYNLATVFSNQTRPDEALAVAREAWLTLSGAPREELALMFRALFIECYHVRGDWGLMWEHLAPAVEHVLAGAQALSMLGVANSALEPAAALGQWPRVLPLVQALDAGLFDDVPVAAEIMLGCAHAALIMDDHEAAAGWLARVLAAGEQEAPRVRCRAALLKADLALSAGAGPAALDGLPADDAPGMNAELRLRALTLRVRAGADAATRALALAALDDPAVHAGAALYLARTLGGSVYAALRQRLAHSLADWPEVQGSFLATWR